ncbi:MAG: hypothetical protein ACTSPE_08760 [Candidatus Thorarchaeota archaeon]
MPDIRIAQYLQKMGFRQVGASTYLDGKNRFRSSGLGNTRE